MAVTDWFSTALRKLIFPARSSAATPKALVIDIVVSSACACSTPPRTASLFASVTWARRSAPCLPIAAASAASPIVFSTATPYLVNSFPSCLICLTISSVSPTVVLKSPYTRLSLITCFSMSIKTLAAVVPRYANGIVKPTIS